METTEIKKDDIRKWVKALRSGEYKQSIGGLQDKKGYCCLGVACDVFIPKKKHKRDEKGFLMGGMPSGQKHSPKWLLEISNIVGNQIGWSLVFLNDGVSINNMKKVKYTFDEIADILELLFIHEVKTI